eukprot:PLAT2948.1.p1 GENE.PLAT2948.1~~PLAT2948.1.p1  ORF type:complete len:542 (+),score=233.39 PLAT2948.1:1622-3247(+)
MLSPTGRRATLDLSLDDKPSWAMAAAPSPRRMRRNGSASKRAGSEPRTLHRSSSFLSERLAESTEDKEPQLTWWDIAVAWGRRQEHMSAFVLAAACITFSLCSLPALVSGSVSLKGITSRFNTGRTVWSWVPQLGVAFVAVAVVVGDLWHEQQLVALSALLATLCLPLLFIQLFFLSPPLMFSICCCNPERCLLDGWRSILVAEGSECTSLLDQECIPLFWQSSLFWASSFMLIITLSLLVVGHWWMRPPLVKLTEEERQERRQRRLAEQRERKEKKLAAEKKRTRERESIRRQQSEAVAKVIRQTEGGARPGKKGKQRRGRRGKRHRRHRSRHGDEASSASPAKAAAGKAEGSADSTSSAGSGTAAAASAAPVATAVEAVASSSSVSIVIGSASRRPSGLPTLSASMSRKLTAEEVRSTVLATRGPRTAAGAAVRAAAAAAGGAAAGGKTERRRLKLEDIVVDGDSYRPAALRRSTQAGAATTPTALPSPSARAVASHSSSASAADAEGSAAARAEERRKRRAGVREEEIVLHLDALDGL